MVDIRTFLFYLGAKSSIKLKSEYACKKLLNIAVILGQIIHKNGTYIGLRNNLSIIYTKIIVSLWAKNSTISELTMRYIFIKIVMPKRQSEPKSKKVQKNPVKIG